jgi:hypothetical protein
MVSVMASSRCCAALSPPAPFWQALGMRLPPKKLTPASVAAAVGARLKISTVDCVTQEPGPRMRLGDWADYMAKAPVSGLRRPLLNCISLSLAATPLQVAPAASRVNALLCCHRHTYGMRWGG